jgi:hypothetical protein
MSESKNGYRALPATIEHPRKAEIVSFEEFDKLDKVKMQVAPSMCKNHLETVIWYAQSFGYVVQIKTQDQQDKLIRSICTFTPTFGMDSIDGAFAQDIEEYVLNKDLGLITQRLDVFGSSDAIDVEKYLQSRGIGGFNLVKPKRPWWKFW